jgi:uncharacterized membrane protein YdbT with pleckstrin-like domain
MLYIEQSLADDEELLHVAHFHWMHDVRAVLNIIFGVIGSVLFLVGSVFMYQKLGKFPPQIDILQAIPYLHPGLRIFSFILFILGLLTFAQMMITKATTEVGITNIRIIYKRGLIARYVGEIAIDRVEGVTVLQSVFGRIFDYGRLAVRGMGVGEVILPPLASPIVLRAAIQKARQHGQRSGEI